MAGFSEVLQTIGAIIIFSLILLTSNRMILSNSMKEVESEAEGIAVTLAQNIIEEAQSKSFDEATTDSMVPLKTPEEFTAIESEEGNNRKDFDDFDDYDTLNDVSFDTELGEDTFMMDVDVAYVSAGNNYDIAKGSKTNPTHFKKMRVTVTSDYLDNNNKQVQLEYLQRYYKTKN